MPGSLAMLFVSCTRNTSCGPWATSRRAGAAVASFLFRQQLLPEHKAELNALADELHMDPADAMLANCFLDLIPMTTCSTVALPPSAAPDGVARFGRNLDFPAFNIADKYSVLLIVKPAGRYAFAAISWPGLIGVLSGMNEHGLALASMEVDREGGLPVAMPYTLLYRSILERCKTVDEAIALLQSTPRQTPNNLMLMDASGNRAVAEITPEKVVVRRGQAAAALVSTNHHRGTDQDTPGQCRRYDYLHDASKTSFGKIGVAQIETMLGHVAQGKLTLQSMIFEPSTRLLYLATGSVATSREYRRIDLKEDFGK